MFGMGLPEIMVVLVLALVILGPEKLPKMARTIGKGIRELRKATTDLRRAVDMADIREDIKIQIEDNARRPDPYAGLAEEEEAWRASIPLTAAEDAAEQSKANGFEGDFETTPPAGAIESSFIDHGTSEPASREIDGAITAVRLPAAVPDPFTVYVAQIKGAEPTSATKVAVEGGVTALLLALEGVPEIQAVPLTPIEIPKDADGVTIGRSAIVAPPLALLGGVQAVPIADVEVSA